MLISNENVLARLNPDITITCQTMTMDVIGDIQISKPVSTGTIVINCDTGYVRGCIVVVRELIAVHSEHCTFVASRTEVDAIASLVLNEVISDATRTGIVVINVDLDAIISTNNDILRNTNVSNLSNDTSLLSRCYRRTPKT